MSFIKYSTFRSRYKRTHIRNPMNEKVKAFVHRTCLLNRPVLRIRLQKETLENFNRLCTVLHTVGVK